MRILPLLSLILASITITSAAQDSSATASASQHDDKTSIVMGSPALSNAFGTKQQQTYMGSLLGSVVRSEHFCDSKTFQYGGYATVSDNVTKATPASAPVYVITDEAQLEVLHGGKGAKDDKGNPTDTTRNFFSGTAHFYANNSLGIGAQQSITGEVQHTLVSCDTASKKFFFPSVGIGLGAVSERLYYTPARLYSAILPMSAQATYVISRLDKKKHQDLTKAPRAILSAQLGYTPLLNALHAYQLYENAAVIFPTAAKGFTISVSQSDYYVNNAPSPDKRNYQTETIQLNFAFTSDQSPPQAATLKAGACYTSDKTTHLYCYNTSNSNACPAPSIFRVGGRCATSGIHATQ